MSLDSVHQDGRLIVALASEGGGLGELSDPNLRRRGLEDYELPASADVLEVLASVNGGEFCHGQTVNATIQAVDGGRRLHVDVQSVEFLTAGGGPTEWLTVTWRGEVTAYSTESGHPAESRYCGTSEDLAELVALFIIPGSAWDYSVSTLGLSV